MSPYAATIWGWGVWALSWTIAAVWSNRTQATPGRGAELVHRLVTLAGVALLFFGRRLTGDGAKLWSAPLEFKWGLFALTMTGFALCWWARLHLGRLWSGAVTLKADHRIVDTGPYRWVRHPIYTGLILAAAATATLQATAVSFAGLAVIVPGLWIKARLEERFLRAELGADAYDAYARRTGMLFPGL
jgi:protein-S-isoprenylcysteine O-methyltransferase Ste14